MGKAVSNEPLTYKRFFKCKRICKSRTYCPVNH